jgi:uncharacterized RDD family membrane protein YckC
MNCTNHPDVIAGVVRCARCGQPFCQDCVVLLDGRPYDAACKEEQIRDLRSGATELTYATSLRRWGGISIDWLIFTIGFWIVSAIFFAVTGTVKNATPGLGTVFLVQLILPSLFFSIYEGALTSGGGQTLGKRLLGMRVVNADGSTMETGTAWKRAGARFLMAVTVILNLVDIFMIFSENHRTLRDRMADTVVLRRA